jgi:hypothetical protein
MLNTGWVGDINDVSDGVTGSRLRSRPTRPLREIGISASMSLSSHSCGPWSGHQLLQRYVYDLFLRRLLKKTAKEFDKEAAFPGIHTHGPKRAPPNRLA